MICQEYREQISTLLPYAHILPPRSQFILKARLEGLTYKKLSEHLGICKERVRQIEQKSLRQLRRYARSNTPRCLILHDYDLPATPNNILT